MLGIALQRVTPSGHDHELKYSITAFSPTYAELRVAGESDSISIEKHNGFKSVMENCPRASWGISMPGGVHPSRYPAGRGCRLISCSRLGIQHPRRKLWGVNANHLHRERHEEVEAVCAWGYSESHTCTHGKPLLQHLELMRRISQGSGPGRLHLMPTPCAFAKSGGFSSVERFLFSLNK